MLCSCCIDHYILTEEVAQAEEETVENVQVQEEATDIEVASETKVDVVDSKPGEEKQPPEEELKQEKPDVVKVLKVYPYFD